MRIAGIDHVVIRTVDHAAMLRFYTEALGCGVERARPEIGLWHLRAGDSLIDLVPVDGKLGGAGGAAPGREGRNMDHLCLKVADFDLERVRAHLQAHGVSVGDAGVRYGASGEGTSVYIQDPDGNGVELRG